MSDQPTQIDTLIAPVGKQPMPVLLPILEYGPARSYLIPTVESREEAKAVAQVAEQAGRRVQLMEQVNPYVAEETYRRCREVAEVLPEGARAAINISGGTTLMALGAQQAARELGMSMVYVNTDDGVIIWLHPDGRPAGSRPLATRLSAERYAAAHSAKAGPVDHWSASWDDDPAWNAGIARKEPYLSAALMLGRSGAASARPLQTLRRDSGRLGFALDSPTPEELAVLDRLAEMGFLSRQAGATPSYALATTYDRAGELLNGHWLEVYIADACARSGLFDDVRCSVKLTRTDGQRTIDNELDVLVVSRGRMAAISCKTGNEFAVAPETVEGKPVHKGEGKSKTEKRQFALFQLTELLQADLMGLYARKVLATNYPGIDHELFARAYYSETCCITGPRLSKVAQIVYDHLERPQKGI